MDDSDSDRMRQHPGDRFAGDLLRFDIDEQVEQLREESMQDGHQEQGHLQKELHRTNDKSVSLFHFDSGSCLPEHTLEDGLVYLHVLSGSFEIDTEQETVGLSDNQVMTILPGISHSLQAREDGQILLYILRD